METPGCCAGTRSSKATTSLPGFRLPIAGVFSI
jgi:hypothetical protein